MASELIRFDEKYRGVIDNLLGRTVVAENLEAGIRIQRAGRYAFRGLWVVAAALEGENALTADWTGPLALVIGSEGEGISRLTLSLCDRRVTLPMLGEISSLNASVAAGVLLYQVVRARGGGQ